MQMYIDVNHYVTMYIWGCWARAWHMPGSETKSLAKKPKARPQFNEEKITPCTPQIKRVSGFTVSRVRDQAIKEYPKPQA